MPWAAIIPAVASLAAAGIGAAASSSSAAANRASEDARAQANYEQQKEFAQHGIRWKVEDAQAAGIHPLFGLNASTAQFSPSQFVGTQDQTGDILSRGISQAGQDIGRAVSAGKTPKERNDTQLYALQLERAGLENELLRSQIIRSNSQIGAGIPSAFAPQGGLAGQQPALSNTNLGTYQMDPNEVPTRNPSNLSTAAGPAEPYAKWVRTGGGLIPMPPKSLGVEDEFGAPGYTEWLIRNRLPGLIPGVSPKNKPDISQIQSEFPGAVDSRWSWYHNSWIPVYPSDRVTGRDIRESIHYGGNTPTNIHRYSRYPRNPVANY